MKKLLTLAVLVTFLSCDKKKSEPVKEVPVNDTNTNSAGGKLPRWDIPNWRHGDTLGNVVKPDTQPPAVIDSMYTYSEGYTAMIIYQGKKYYVWIQGTYKEEKLLPDQKSYTNCIISPTMNAEDAINKGVECTVWPNRYIDENGLWVYQKQAITFNGSIPTINGNYYIKI